MTIVKSFSFPIGEIRGDTFYIKHGSNSFTVIDCYLKDGNGADCRKDEIINEICKESNGRIRSFISTHPDNDHIKGIEDLFVKWTTENFYAVANERPADKEDPSLTKYQQLMKDHNYAIEKGIRRVWLNQEDEKKENSSSGIFFHWPVLSNEKFKEALKSVKEEGKSINNISCIFTYQVKGGASYMWMGDMMEDMQKEYYEKEKANIPHADILFHPHHGRESSKVPTELLDAINPQLIVIGNAPSDKLNYGDSRMTITQNKAGDIVFENDGNKVHVYTKNKIDNPPACLKKEVGKKSKHVFKDGMFVIDWYYVGTMTISNE